MTAWLRLAMQAWVTAVLVVSPVLAASHCQACCAEKRIASSSAAGCCAHHAPVKQAACCTTPQATSDQKSNGQSCPQCPRCERSRPAPLSTAPTPPVLVDLGFTWIAVIVEPTATLESPLGAAMEVIPHRSASVLFSRWLI